MRYHPPVLALALLIALDAPPPQQIAFIGDEQLCAGESVTREVAQAARALPATKLVDANVIIVAPSVAQLALDRGAFMKLIHAELDAVRVAAPKAWIVLAAPNAAHAREWLNAVMHKRGDAALSFVVFPTASTTRDECRARAAVLANEARARLSR